jgi:Icc-related predicted phosphoesterase
MKILATSDLHNRRDWYDWLLKQAPKYDAVVIAGDLLDMATDIYPQVEFLGNWIHKFEKLGTHLLICCGNHDLNDALVSRLINGARGAEKLDVFMRHVVMCEHWMDALAESAPQCVVSGMVKSLPKLKNMVVSSLFYDTQDDLLNNRLMKKGAALRRKISLRPLWIVLHHAPPVGEVGDRDLGSPLLGDLIEEYQPHMVFCGHDHKTPFDNHTCCDRVGLTYIFNPGHAPHNSYPCHIVIDTETMKYQWNK